MPAPTNTDRVLVARNSIAAVRWNQAARTLTVIGYAGTPIATIRDMTYTEQLAIIERLTHAKPGTFVQI